MINIFFNRPKKQRSESEESEEFDSYVDSDSSIADSLKMKYGKGLYYCPIYTTVLLYLLSYCRLHNGSLCNFALCISLINQDMPICQFTNILDYVAKGKKRDELKNRLKKDNAETYGLANSSKNTAKIPKSGSSISLESGDNNARNSINRKKSRKSQLNSEDNIEFKGRRKSRKSQLNSEDDIELKGQRKPRSVQLDSEEDEHATERRKPRSVQLDSEENEHAMERNKSKGSRRSDSQLLDPDVKSGKPKRYDKLGEMNQDLKEALRVNESSQFLLFIFCDI